MNTPSPHPAQSAVDAATAPASAASSTDRIERTVTLQAPRARVWRALSNAEEFGTWFRADLTGQRFVPGERARGHMTYPGYEHIFFDVMVERVQPTDRLSFHWHPYPMDQAIDYAKEPPTRVEFTLEDAPGGGTRLTVVESGFDQLPPHRRLEAFRMNSRGWEGQMDNIARHVTSQS